MTEQQQHARESITRVAAPLRRQISDLLRTAVGTGEYPPGTRLVERDLCSRYGVSRTVIREALRHLEAEKLVTVVPNVGPIVTEITHRDVAALYEVRAALEGLAGRLFTARATPELKERLSHDIERVGQCVEDENLEMLLSSKKTFYETLLNGARNEVLRELFDTLFLRIQVTRGLSLSAPGRPQEMLDELRGILDAIMASEEDRAEELCKKHVSRALDVVLDELRVPTGSPEDDSPAAQRRG